MPRSPRPILQASIVASFFLAFYLATLSRNLALAHDSVYYLHAIETGIDLFHPHHLFYAPLARAWLLGLRLFAPQVNPTLAVDALNSVAGALGAAVSFLLLRRRFGLSVAAAFVGTALAGLSFGYWFYSVCIEVYLIPLSFLLLTLHVLSGGPFTGRRAAAVACLHALAVVFHQVHVLFGSVVVAAWAWTARRDFSGALRGAAAYLALVIPLVVIPYVLVMAVPLRLHSAGEGWLWLTTYARQSEFWSPLALSTAVKAGVGALRAVFGMHFAFAVPAVRQVIGRVFPGQLSVDEMYLVRPMAPATGVVLLCLAVAVLAGTALGWLGGWRRKEPLDETAARTLLLLGVWIATYAVFFFFWVPFNPEFWIPQVTAGWLAFAGVLLAPRAGATSRSTWLWLASYLALGLLVVNGLGTIRWTAAADRDYYSVQTAPLSHLSREGDLVVFGRKWILEGYLRRLSPAEGIGILESRKTSGGGEAFEDSLEMRVHGALARGGRVWVSREAVELEPPVTASLGRDTVRVRRLWAPYAGAWRAVHEGPSLFYEIVSADTAQAR
jgi:hypothetical protein